VLRLFIVLILSLIISPLFGASGFLIPEGENLAIILQLRLPRVLLALIVGSGLSLLGVVLQSFFRNELASPYTLGIASTASFGSVLALFLGFSGIFIEFTGVIFSLISLLIMLILYRYGYSKELSRLLLIGLSLGFISSSGIFFMQYLGGVERSFEIYRCLAGGLEITSITPVILSSAVLILFSLIIFKNSTSFDLLQVSHEFAKGRGVNIKFITYLVITSTAIISGIFVSICGPIGFIGLIIPHIGRKFVGASHKKLIPYSMLLGAIFLILIDLIARTLFSPIEIPVGIISSLIGGPFFIFLILKKK
jgi:iron complex transport system permease protein